MGLAPAKKPAWLTVGVMDVYGENNLSFSCRMIQSWTTRKANHKTTLIPFTSESPNRIGFTIAPWLNHGHRRRLETFESSTLT
jgi:hypothetical protein